MEISENMKDEYMGFVVGSPVLQAQMNGSVLACGLLQKWDGSTVPPEPECPYKEDTQDALCRAFRSGVLMAQAVRIEEMLGLALTQ